MKKKLEKENLIEVIERAEECAIAVSDGGIAIHASNNEILTLVALIVDTVKEILPKEALMNAIETGYMSDEEKKEKMVDILLKKFKRTFEGEE